MYGTLAKGPRYLEMAEGYVTGIALDADDQIIGYQFVNLGKMTDNIKNGMEPNEAYKAAQGQYGRVADAVKIIDPRRNNPAAAVFDRMNLIDVLRRIMNHGII